MKVSIQQGVDSGIDFMPLYKKGVNTHVAPCGSGGIGLVKQHRVDTKSRSYLRAWVRIKLGLGQSFLKV